MTVPIPIELRDILQVAIDEHAGDLIIPEVAVKVLAQLEEEQPTLLASWMHDLTVGMLERMIREKINQSRSILRHHGIRAFRDGLLNDAIRNGSLEPFEQMYSIAPNVRRRVGEMTGADHLLVAEHCDNVAAGLKLEAEFHRQVAKKVGKRRTEEVFTPETYLKMMSSFSQPD